MRGMAAGPQLTEEGIEEVLEEIRPFLKMVRRATALSWLRMRAPAAARACSLYVAALGRGRLPASVPRAAWGAADGVPQHIGVRGHDQFRNAHLLLVDGTSPSP